jgi:hypothetical protein
LKTGAVAEVAQMLERDCIATFTILQDYLRTGTVADVTQMLKREIVLPT